MTKNDITRKGKNLAFLLRHDKEAFGDGRIDRHGKPFVIKIDSIMSKAHWPQGRNLRSLMSFANNDVNMDRKSGAIMVPPFSLITFIDALTSFPQDSATGSPPGD